MGGSALECVCVCVCVCVCLCILWGDGLELSPKGPGRRPRTPVCRPLNILSGAWRLGGVAGWQDAGGAFPPCPKGPGGEVWLWLRSPRSAVCVESDRRGPCGLELSSQWGTIGEALPLTCVNTSGSRRDPPSLRRGGGTVADENPPGPFSSASHVCGRGLPQGTQGPIHVSLVRSQGGSPSGPPVV